ncbi:Pr6Pr family membrane protein [Streptomyces sp. H27-D2]|uniref:Pr6Pr family membrane protein n=1 Tax=Streptomyces sp. H27-D2 TaxID=3046304 RepID=UPI002DBB40E2|nr:Pr6Pr family membrane protein [Streptomyces sp. H27-D2]MEC4014974.1 Pr6Pr family membrane protein [Streptomyces sp. H27-D2]
MTGDITEISGARSVSNQLLHTVTPIAVAVDWLLLTLPGGLRLRYTWQWLAYPLAYLAFTLILGAALAPGTEARYLYPFLDVGLHGCAGVLTNSAVFGLSFYVLTVILSALDRVRPDLRGTR